MMGALIDDLKLDNGVEILFKKLIDPSDEDANGLILDKKTTDGDTILHRIVHATVDSSGNMKYYMQIVDKIYSRSAEWYLKYKHKSPVKDRQIDKGDVNNVRQIKEVDMENDHNMDNIDEIDEQHNDNVEKSDDKINEIKEPSNLNDQQNDSNCKQKDDNETKKLTHTAMTVLLKYSEDQHNRSIWKVAIEKAAIKMIEKLMYLDGVTWNNDGCFDVSFFFDTNVPKQNIFVHLSSLFGFGGMHLFGENLSALLQDTRDETKYDELMRVKPMKKLIDIFTSIRTKITIAVVILHLLYISLFSYLGCELMDARNPTPTYTTKVLIYSCGLLQPIILTLYIVANFIRLLFWIKGSCGIAKIVSKLKQTEYTTLDLFWQMLYWICICTYNVSQYIVILSVGREITFFRRVMLSGCLLLGWLMTFVLATGIMQIHFFFKFLWRVIVLDVIRVFLIYAIFWFAYSLALHVQFISSTDITMRYHSLIDTMFMMFNVMVGMQEAVDEETVLSLYEVNVDPYLSKALYMAYVVFSTIVLLNLLIAMMNTSYSTTRVDHRNEWVLHAVRFGTKTATHFPCLANFLGTNRMKKRKLFDYSEESVFTIKLSHADMKLDDLREDSNNNNKMLRRLEYNIEHSEKILKAEILDLKRSQNELINLFKDMQGTNARRTRTQ